MSNMKERNSKEFIDRHINALYLQLPECIADINKKVIKDLQAALSAKEEEIKRLTDALEDFKGYSTKESIARRREKLKDFEF